MLQPERERLEQELEENHMHVCLKDGRMGEILWGVTAAVELIQNPKALQKLLASEVRDTYDPPKIILWRTRGMIRNLFSPAERGVGRVSTTAREALKTAVDWTLYRGGWTEKDEVHWTLNDAEQLVKDGNFAILKVGEDIVGCAAFKKGLLPGGVTFHEITKLSTLPDLRGQGVNRGLREKVLEIINAGPEDIVVSCTKNEAEIRKCQRSGWKEIPLHKYLLLQRLAGKEWSPEMVERAEDWRAFVHDPGKHLSDIIETQKYEKTQRPLEEFQFPQDARDPKRKGEIRAMGPEEHSALLSVEIEQAHDKRKGVRRYLEQVQFLAPLGHIQHALRTHFESTGAAGTDVPPEFDPNALSNFDPNSPLFSWVDSPSDFALNPHRDAYEDVNGRRYIGPNNVGFVQTKKGQNGDTFEQVVSLISNHGEIIPLVQFLRRHGFFGDPRRPLRMRQSDGHADATGANSAHLATKQEKDVTHPVNFFEGSTINDARNSISSHNCYLVDAGDYNPNHLVLKSNTDGWREGNNDACWYRMAYRFHGPTGTVILDVEPENDLLTDRQVASDQFDIANLDMDRQYYEQSPKDIAWSIRKEVETVANDPLVILVPSPGWLDEEVGLLLCQIKAELLRPEPNRAEVRAYLGTLYTRFMAIGAQCANDQTRSVRGQTYYAYFASVASKDEADRNSVMQSDVDQMFSILFEQECVFGSAVNTDEFEVSYYHEPLGHYGEYLQKRRIAAALETQHKLLPSLHKSPYEDMRSIAGAFETSQPITNEDLLQRAIQLPDISEQAPQAKQEGAPVDHAIEKIVYHLEHNFTQLCAIGKKDEVLSDFRLLLGILKSPNITRKPITIQREMHSWMSRFGARTGLFAYPYTDVQGQSNTWRLRCTGVNGPFSDFEDKDALTIEDIRSILEVGGGGSVTVSIGTEEGQKRECIFSYGMHDPRRQAAAELLAHLYVNKHFWTDASGVIVSPVDGNTEGLTRWNLTACNVEEEGRTGAIRAAVTEHFPKTQESSRSPSFSEAVLALLTSFHNVILIGRQATRVATYNLNTERDPHRNTHPTLELAEQCYRAFQSWAYDKGRKAFQELRDRLSQDDLAPELVPLREFCQSNRQWFHQTGNILEELWTEQLERDEIVQHPVRAAIGWTRKNILRRAFLQSLAAAAGVGGAIALGLMARGSGEKEQVEAQTPIELTETMGFIPLHTHPQYRERWRAATEKENILGLLEESFAEHVKVFPDACHAIRDARNRNEEPRLGAQFEIAVSWMLTLYHTARLRSMYPFSGSTPEEVQHKAEFLIREAYEEYEAEGGRGRSTTAGEGVEMFLHLYQDFESRVGRSHAGISREDTPRDNPLNRLPDSSIRSYLDNNGYLPRP